MILVITFTTMRFYSRTILIKALGAVRTTITEGLCKLMLSVGRLVHACGYYCLCGLLGNDMRVNAAYLSHGLSSL
jgi:hypothetical protein